MTQKKTNEVSRALKETVSLAILSVFCIACCLSSGYTQKAYDSHTNQASAVSIHVLIHTPETRFSNGHENQEHTSCRTLVAICRFDPDITQEMTPSTFKNINLFNVSNTDWICEPKTCAPTIQHLTSRITWRRDGVLVHPAFALLKLSGKYMSTRRTPKHTTHATAPNASRIPESHQLPTSTHPVQSRSPRSTAPLGRVRLTHK